MVEGMTISSSSLGQAEIGGVPMRWIDEGGAGTPVVLVHGIPTGPLLWRHVLPQLTHTRTLAWEMVGYAGSIKAGIGRNISVAHQADYLSMWMRHMGVSGAVVVGHDLGGGVAQILAVRHPSLVSGLVLTNAITHDSWPIPSVRALRATADLTEHLPPPAVKAIFATLFARGHDDAVQADEAMETHWPFYADADPAAALLRQIRALDVNDTLAVSGRVEMLEIPASIVWGADDDFQKLEYGHRLAQQLKAPLDAIEGGKHFVPEDHPDRIAAAIQSVVERVREGIPLPG